MILLFFVLFTLTCIYCNVCYLCDLCNSSASRLPVISSLFLICHLPVTLLPSLFPCPKSDVSGSGSVAVIKQIRFSDFCHTLFSSLLILCPHQIQLSFFNRTCQSTLHHADSCTSWICSCMLALYSNLPSHSIFYAQKLSSLVTFLSVWICFIYFVLLILLLYYPVTQYSFLSFALFLLRLSAFYFTCIAHYSMLSRCFCLNYLFPFFNASVTSSVILLSCPYLPW